MYRITAFCFFACSFFSCHKNSSNIKLSPLFSDGMVLQRSTKINIWGSALPNKDVKIISSWSEGLEIKSNDSGIWSGNLQTPEAGGPFALKIISENENISIADEEKINSIEIENANSADSSDINIDYSSDDTKVFQPIVENNDNNG